MNGACWARMRATWAGADLGDSTVMHLAVALAAAALLLSVLLAPWVLRRYRQRVQRLMNFREVGTPPEAWWVRRAQRRGHDDVAAWPQPAPPLATLMAQRRRRVLQASLAAYAVVLLFVLAIWPGWADMDLGDITGALLVVALLAAGPVMLNVQPEGGKRWLLVGSVLAAAAALALEEELDAESVIAAGAIVGCLYLMTVHRTLRAVVMPLMVLGGGLTVGVILGLVALTPWVCVSDDGRIDLANLSWLMLGLGGAACAVALGLWLAARVLAGLAWLVERRWLSDGSLTAAMGLAVLLLVLAASLDAPGVAGGWQALAWLAGLAAVAGAYVVVLRRQPCPPQGRRLLMLRVFSRDRRSERLLDSLQSRWQYAGPVMEIGGPDLVAINLDLHEFIHFATLRLHELFQPAMVSGALLRQSLALAADREGRFAINELFCFGSSWQAVVDQLLGLADVVLLDLRGFNAQRAGTAHEVGRLAALGLLPRVVAVTDASTDWAEVQRHIAAAGQAGAEPAARIDATDKAALQRALDALLAVADQPRPA